ncbi:MAG: methionine--tRNA ligase [Bacteroidota bacterium]|nr:methionine--tRNA ligase [Bacteroidota bacterium]
MAYKRTLVTSALPYANGPIHLGHLAGAYMPADFYVRYQRLKGRDIVYVCGSDEYGVAIVIRAMQEGVKPQDIIDRYHPLIKESFAKVGMSFDHYSRTTSPVHADTSQDFFRRLAARDDFVLRREEQLFDPKAGVFLADRFVCGTCPKCSFEEAFGDQCEQCGTSLNPADILNPRSTLTDAVPEHRQTTHWYLPLGRWQPALEQYVASHPEWKPNVLGQIGSWFADGLRDRAITRDVPWGIPVPAESAEAAGVDATGKVIYVWFDAPIGYISATREWAEKLGTPERWEIYWKDDETRLIHFIGKDNIVFHTLMFPAMLMAYDEYVVPDSVPANEFLTIEGRKLSTSRGWAVWLHEYLDEFEPDLLRYVLGTTFPETKDADFSWNEFQTRVNSELADILGNFVNRALTFAEREFDGAVPELTDPSAEDRAALETLAGFPDRIARSYERFRFREAVAETMNLARLGNKYFNDTAPWKTRKSDRIACGNTVHVSLQICAGLSVLMEPVLPFTAARLRAMLRLTGVRPSTPGPSDSSAVGWDEAGSSLLTAGHALGRREILFSKISNQMIQKQVTRLESAGQEAELPYAELKKTIQYDDFARLDLRTGHVLSAERITKSRKLLRLRVDIGSETRQILAGVAEHFEPCTLVGCRVVVVANLAPRKMMGLESQGMLLMAEDRAGQLALVTADSESGAVVR